MLGHSLVTWRVLPGGGQLQQRYVCGGGVGVYGVPGGTVAALAIMRGGRLNNEVFHCIIMVLTQRTKSGAVAMSLHCGLL
jgi:hypothetical protein